MPTATDAQRALMGKWFGDSIDLTGPLSFLHSHGFTDVAGFIIPPVPSHNVSHDELRCIAFLVHEWDFGWAGK